MSVPQQHGAGLGGAEQSFGPTQVEHLALGAEHDRDDGGVAGDPPGGLRGQQGARVEAAQGGGRADPLGEVGQAHGQQQGGLGPAGA